MVIFISVVWGARLRLRVAGIDLHGQRFIACDFVAVIVYPWQELFSIHTVD